MDATGAPLARYGTGAYGETGGSEVDSGTVANALRFKARERDAATGLVDLRARWYDPMSGRFLSEDPLGLAGGWNPYAFAGNDPVNYSDPSGLDACNKIQADHGGETITTKEGTKECLMGSSLPTVFTTGRSGPGAGGGDVTTWFAGVSGFAAFVGGPSVGGGVYRSSDGDFGLYGQGGAALGVGAGGGVEAGRTTSMTGKSVSECAYAGPGGVCGQLGGRGLTGVSGSAGPGVLKIGVYTEVATTRTLSYFDIVRGFFGTNFGADTWAAYRRFYHPLRR